MKRLLEIGLLAVIGGEIVERSRRHPLVALGILGGLYALSLRFWPYLVGGCAGSSLAYIAARRYGIDSAWWPCAIGLGILLGVFVPVAELVYIWILAGAAVGAWHFAREQRRAEAIMEAEHLAAVKRYGRGHVNYVDARLLPFDQEA